MPVLITIAIVLTILVVMGFTPNSLNSGKDWIDILTALGTPSIALMTGWIAYQQWQTNEKARKNAAFHRYLDNYQKLTAAITFIVSKKDAGEDALRMFLAARAEAHLYLCPEVVEYTEKLVDMAIDLVTLQDEIQDMPNCEERNQKNRKRLELKRQLILEDTEKVYRKYLFID